MGPLNDVKERVKQILKDRCGRDYERTYCHALSVSGYSNTIEKAEEKFCMELNRQSQKDLPMCQVVSYEWEEPVSLEKIRPDSQPEIFIFLESKAKLRENALQIIGQWASCHRFQLCFYGDDDVFCEGVRQTPWLKPEWSPQLFESMFYLGGVFAVRKDVVVKAQSLCDAGGKMVDFARTILYCAGGKEKRPENGKETIGHIPYVLCHHKSEREYEKYLKIYEDRPDDISQQEVEITSVIIPSKDQPEVLERNIRSLVRTTLGEPLEIIVVDNGSCEENKSRVQKLLNELAWHKVQYIYEPMEFNFSGMCNLGAAKACGKYYLFLNDDTEALSEGWLEKLRRKAAKPQVGAVGAKLLYPGTDKIQHAGIVNIPMGPVHKLQFQSDNNTYYFKRNKVCSNVLAVTGACLMVRAECFKEVGGFSEELPVAFNDVDICFSLYEKGYYNVVCNDVALYHHESLSRGDDESLEKLTRLDRERTKLYERHTGLEGRDPYYHCYLNREGLDTRIVAAPEEWMENGNRDVKVRRIQPLPALEENGTGSLRLHKGLYVRVESVGGNFCQGYSFMSGDDNACYKKELLLENQDSGETYAAPVRGILRQDLQDNMPDQKNVAMCGFSVNLKGLPSGTYSIGMMAKNKVTGVTYVNRCARRLCVGKNY